MLSLLFLFFSATLHFKKGSVVVVLKNALENLYASAIVGLFLKTNAMSV
jgi:hypothetical protein